MSDQFRTKPVDLMKVWGMAKSSDQRQFTVRVPADTFYRVQALEAMYPHRSRNELISDLLATALDEFEEALPFKIHEGTHIVGYDDQNQPVYEGWESGPRAQFRAYIEETRSNSSKTAELKVVETVEGAA